VAGVEGRLAGRGISASISRTGIAAAALTVAVAATVGVGIMVDSFRGSVSAWLSQTLASDLYVSAAGASEGGEGALPDGLYPAVQALPGVAAVSRGRGARVQAAAGPVRLLALDPTRQSRAGLRFIGETSPNLWPRFEAGELILISEPYAWHHRLGIGDRVSLFTAKGWRDFPIGGVFVDYGSDSGMLVLMRDTYARLWQDPGVSTLGVLLEPGADLEGALRAVRELAAGYDEALTVTSNRSIREESLAIFDRTFVITRVLRLLAVGVAFVGVLSALMALQLERAREHAILRATGVTRGGLLGLILLQTSILGLVAGLLAIPMGWILGALLIHVVNVRSFGWTMEMAVPADALVLGVALAWGAALLAGLYPAARATRTDPAAALRAE
jgi:putative ABC transport system permease protein